MTNKEILEAYVQARLACCDNDSAMFAAEKEDHVLAIMAPASLEIRSRLTQVEKLLAAIPDGDKVCHRGNYFKLTMRKSHLTTLLFLVESENL